MKLNEIFGVEPHAERRVSMPLHRTPSIRDARAALTKHGPDDTSDRKPKSFEYKGAGAYGTAFTKKSDPNFVRKIGSISGAPGGEEDGYLKFLQIVKAHPNNPYFPKIHKLRIYSTSGTDPKKPSYYIVDMERLTPGVNADNQQVAVLLNRLFGQDRQHPNTRFNTIAEKISRAVDGSEEYYDEIMQGPADRNFKQAVTLLRDARIRGQETDLHSGNVMFRRTGHGLLPVITDPFV